MSPGCRWGGGHEPEGRRKGGEGGRAAWAAALLHPSFSVFCCFLTPRPPLLGAWPAGVCRALAACILCAWSSSTIAASCARSRPRLPFVAPCLLACVWPASHSPRLIPLSHSCNTAAALLSSLCFCSRVDSQPCLLPCGLPLGFFAAVRPSCARARRLSMCLFFCFHRGSPFRSHPCPGTVGLVLLPCVVSLSRQRCRARLFLGCFVTNLASCRLRREPPSRAASDAIGGVVSPQADGCAGRFSRADVVFQPGELPLSSFSIYT